VSEQAMAAPAPKRSRFTLPSAYTILFALIVLAAIATWIIPAGTYDLNEAGEPIPGTYHEVEAKPSRIVVDSLTAPINGLYGIEDAKGNINYYNSGTLFGAIDIALFIIVIGGFLGITMKTGAIQAGIGSLVQRMKGIDEGGASLLDNSILMFASSLFDGDAHSAEQLPIVLAGKAGGALRTGRVLDYLDKGDDNRRACSLYLSLMDMMGVRLDRFGDTDKRLAGL